jgi:hypothetical protein
MSGTGSRSSGWVAFAGWFLIVVGAVDALEGLIAVARQHYYLFVPNANNQIIVFDVKTWGWVTLTVGALIVFAGLGVLTGIAVARWFAIAIVTFSVIEQLAFVGNIPAGLWPLTSIAFSGVALYALIVRWDEDTSTT